MTQVAYGVIYKVSLYGKVVYVGQTIQLLEKRWRQHINDAKNRPRNPFQYAINKYGSENFIIEPICECSYQDEMDDKEVYYTDFYDAGVDRGGYVCRVGNGRGKISEISKQKMSQAKRREDNPLRGKPLLEETKKKLSESHKGKRMTEKARKKMSIAKSGDNHPNYGKPLSDRTKYNIGMANSKEYDMMSPTGNLVHIINMSQFCREYGLTSANMHKVLSGKIRQHKGWRRNNEYYSCGA